MEQKNDDLNYLIDMGYTQAQSKEALSRHPGNLALAIEFLINNEEKHVNEERKAKSYKCIDTGKKFRTMAEAQIYAEKTGNSNFEECEDEIPPLTEAEKKEKLAYYRQLLAEKKAAREEQMKVEDIEREKNRRKEGQEMLEAKEFQEKQKRMFAFEQIRKEKKEDEEHREKLRRDIAQDKGNRAAEKAKKEGKDASKAYKEAYESYLNNTQVQEKAPIEKIDQILSAINVLEAKKQVLETIKKMVENILNDLKNEKFRRIKVNNPAFQKRVGVYKSGLAFFKVLGFVIELTEDNEEMLVLNEDNLNTELLKTGLKRISEELGI